MDTSKYVVKNTSYQNLFDSFVNVFPEWKNSVKEWKKDEFSKHRRTILITMKNGICIRFGSYITEDGGAWVWSTYAIPSDKTREKFGFESFDEKDDFIDISRYTCMTH